VTFAWCRHSLALRSSDVAAADRADVFEATATTVWSRSQFGGDIVACGSVGIADVFCRKHVLVHAIYSFIFCLTETLFL